MDLFKPLYKSHRRGDVENIFEAGLNRKYPTELYHVSEQEMSLRRNESKGYEAYDIADKAPNSYQVTEVEELPGLRIISGFFAPELQAQLCIEALTDFLSNPEHLTNLDAHHQIPRPIDLWASESKPICATMPTTKFREKGLRWVTLGGQYNWTTKKYPTFEIGAPGCPAFPTKLAAVCGDHGVRAEAAIVNFYSEGDILSPHQDVAELCRQDLISVSLGCECIFYVGKSRHDCEPFQIRLKSGDAVIMGGESRFAWHGVGRVFAGTTPEAVLASIDDQRVVDYMRLKRINVNVRQMRD